MENKSKVEKRVEALRKKERIVSEQLIKTENEGEHLKSIQIMLEDTLKKLRKDEVELRQLNQKE